MPGPVPGIHVFSRSGAIGVDGRVKPGHDENERADQLARDGIAIARLQQRVRE